MDAKKIFRSFFTMQTALALMITIVLISLVSTVAFPDADVFHKTPFRMLLVVFCFNLALCTKNQIKSLIYTTRRVPRANPHSSWQSAKIKVSSNTAPQEAVEQFLLTNNYRYEAFEENGDNVYYADKNLLGRWGTAGVHAALLIVAVGALAGSLLGFTSAVIVGKSEAVPLPLSREAKGEAAQIELRDFRIEYYPDGSVSEYISEVEVSSGSERVRDLIKVNHPLNFKNITLYQMSYGSQALARIYGSDGVITAYAWLADERKMLIDNTDNITVQFIKYVPDFDPRRPSVSRSPEPNNPKVLYAFYQDNEPVDWGVADMGQRLRLKGREEWMQFDDIRPFSELEVKYDPGLPLVLGGLALLSLAFCLNSYLRYSQLYIKLSKDSGGFAALASASRLSPKDAHWIFNQLTVQLTKGG